MKYFEMNKSIGRFLDSPDSYRGRSKFSLSVSLHPSTLRLRRIAQDDKGTTPLRVARDDKGATPLRVARDDKGATRSQCMSLPLAATQRVLVKTGWIFSDLCASVRDHFRTELEFIPHGQMIKLINIALFLIFVVAACNTSTESEAPVTTDKPSDAFHVLTAPVKMSDLPELIYATGVVESDTEAKPSFKTGGVISRVYVKEGDLVKKGQIIARLNMTEIEAQATQAKFALDKALRDQQRMQNLYADSIVTTEQLQNSGTAVDMAKKSLQIAEFNVAYSEVRSPIEGKVIAQLLHEGEITGPGIPVVYIIGVRQGDWKIVAGLTDKDWGRVRVGDSAMIRLDAYPEWQIEGKVQRLSDVANPMSGTFNVELDLPSKDKRIAAGLLAHLEITPSESEAFQVIPIEALVSSNGRTGIVYVPKDSIAEKRTIQIQRFQGEMIAVLSGLEGATEVITSGSSFLEDGDAIIIN